MDHLQLRCNWIHTLDVINLTSKMLTYYSNTAGVPKYINILKDAKKKSHQVQLPIPNVTLMAIATK